MKIIVFPITGYKGDEFWKLNKQRWHLPFVVMRDKLLNMGHDIQVFPCPVDKKNDFGLYIDFPRYECPLTDKSLCVILEPPAVTPRAYELIGRVPFTRVLTHSIPHVNNETVFYTPFPIPKPLKTFEPGAREKTCVAIYSNKSFSGPGELYTARRQQILSWGKDIDLYGPGWEKDPEILETVNWRGVWNDEKVELMSQYRYAVAYDNCMSEGYCSEKLPDAIYAGCVAIHRGWVPTYDLEEAYEDKFAERVAAHVEEIR